MEQKFSSYYQKGFVILLFLIGMYLVPLRITGFDFSQIPGDLGDSRFNNYILEHGHRYITGEEEHFWTAPFMFPQENNMALSDNLLGTLPVYSFFRIVGNDRETAFQWWFVVMFILNFWAAWFTFYKLTKNQIGAALGAFVFAFSLPVIAQINHVQLMPRFAIPLCFLFLIYFFKTLSPKYFAGFLAMMVFQFYCGMYLGFLLFLAVLVFIVTASFFIIPWKKIVKQNYLFYLKIAGITVIALLLLKPLAGPYMQTVEVMGYRDFTKEIEPGMPRVLSHFYALNDTLFWNSISKTGDYLPISWEHKIFAGGIPWLCLAIVFFMLIFKKMDPEEKGKAMVLFITLFILGVLTLFIYGNTLYKLVLHLPGFASMRVLTRIVLILLFFFSFFVAFSFSKIPQRFYSGIKPMLVGSIISAFLVISDQYVGPKSIIRFSKSEARNRIENMVKIIGKEIKPSHEAFAFMPADSPDFNHTQLDAMLAAQQMNIRCVNGYAASAPGSFGLFWWKPIDEHLDIWLKEKGFTDSTAVLRLY